MKLRCTSFSTPFTHALHDKDAATVIATLSDEVVAFDLAAPLRPRGPKKCMMRVV
jgi:ketosteroid isomerase-like protein